MNETTKVGRGADLQRSDASWNLIGAAVATGAHYTGNVAHLRAFFDGRVAFRRAPQRNLVVAETPLAGVKPALQGSGRLARCRAG